MDYRLIDVLRANQLEVDDLIGFGDEIVRIVSIKETKNGFDVVIANDFDEKEEIEIGDDEQFELFVWG
jgi:hypothetical protein